MSLRLASLLIISLFSVALLTAPSLGISVSVSTGDGSGVATSSSTYSLADSTSLNEQVTLMRSELQKSLQASGTGNNEISQQMTGGSSSLQSSLRSQGSLDISSSGYASADSASLGVGIAAQGDFSLSGQASQGQAESGQDAGVADGLISTSQSLSAGQGAISSQSTTMAGAAGYVGSAAFSQQNDMVATGSFLGDGQLSADLGAVATGKAATSGQASLDGVTYLSDGTMQEISSGSLGMGVMGLRETGNGVGTFDMNVFNKQAADGYSYGQAASTTGGSSSSYDLEGVRWNQNNPQIQLYLNPTGMPTSLTQDSARDAIAAAANTWDDAVAQNLFKDTNTVIVDSTKTVSDPFATSSTMDGYNVNGWWNLGGNTLGLTRYWYNPNSVVGGYKSLLDSDTWYAKEKSWTADWSTAVNSGNSIFDLQSVAVHELGHSIGMGDLYTLPASDPRSSDYAQVMNSYDAPQRTLGNGDRTGAQTLYGTSFESWLSGDINGDMKADLIHFIGGSVESWISNGDGTYNIKSFTPWQGYATGIGSWQVGDVNGDGKADLSQISGSNWVNSWISNGDGTYNIKSFTPWQGYATGIGSWQVGDVSGDGKADLSQISGSNWINSWISNGDGTYSVRSFAF